ncbi:hypothetical protein SAMN04489740_4285 [Arthrobacter alpinus]|uniref:Uncharacterized protein n=1 Tax=Arthrobacter alpinus TaxID=656366 RepID=A0A1H5PIA4_9MICC|nr:hypothetical protein [Arthrobacter alpinus]SEF12771.1 hypothetical protein SAMN04489740_4285 [Arthrobacter alpinus]
MNILEIDRESVISDLRAEIGRQLASRGYSFIDEADLTATSNQWRLAARESAAEQDRPMKTTIVRDRVFAVLMDWPRAGELCAYPPETAEVQNGDEFLRALGRIKGKRNRQAWLPEGLLG